MSFLKQFLILFAMILGITGPAVANAVKTQCICQTGSEPSSQIPFFYVGCKMWLAEQTNCASKTITSAPDTHTAAALQVPQAKSGDTIKIGFVGHWANEYTAPYLGNSIIPTMQAYDANIYLDNTACQGLQDPWKAEGLSAFSVLFTKNRTITFKGNQAISIGIWNRILPNQAANFWAVFQLPSGKTILPYCEDFENQGCIGAVQKNQPGDCIERDGSFQILYCCPHTKEITDKRGTREQTSWRWQSPQACLN